MIPLAAASEAAGDAAGAATDAAASPWLMIGIAVLLVLFAIGLFFLEAFFPSMGLISLMALACMGGALIAAFSVSRTVGFVFIGISVVALPLTAILAIRLLKGAGAVLDAKAAPAEPGEAGTSAGSGPEPGARGIAITPLRPAGTVLFGGRRVSVVADGEMVEADEHVEVIRVEGTRTVVRPVKAG